MFELFNARLHHIADFKLLIQFKEKSNVRHIIKDEHKFNELINKFHEAFEAGSVDGVDKITFKEINLIEDEDVRILKVMEYIVIVMYRLMSRFLVELNALKRMEKLFLKDEDLLKVVLREDDDKKEFLKNLNIITKIFNKEISSLNDLMLHFSRVLRDMEQAIAKENDAIRMRDKMVGTFKDFRARFDVSSSLRDFSKIKHDEQKEEQLIKHSMNLTSLLEKAYAHKNGKEFEKCSDELINGIKNLAKLLKKDDKLMKDYIKSNKVIFLVVTEHFFESITHILEVKINEFKELKDSKYPEKLLNELKVEFAKSLEIIRKLALGHMREYYQEYNKVHAAVSNTKSLINEEQKLEHEVR